MGKNSVRRGGDNMDERERIRLTKMCSKAG